MNKDADMLPENPELPLLEYGLFKPGQPAWFQIREFVQDVVDATDMDGLLRLREGIPILDTAADGVVWGSLITFRDGEGTLAYQRIASLEPERQFRWQKNGQCNVLAGRSPTKDSLLLDEQEWDCWRDPCFSEALEVVAEMAGRPEAQWDFREFFRIQMAYLLLWSSIERLASFRHGFGGDITRKIRKLAEEPLFAAALRTHAGECRTLHRADDPTEKTMLDRGSPGKAIAYYYQVRCNVAHRGKSMMSDLRHVRLSLMELHEIFTRFIREAELDAQSGVPGSSN
jgi:hypothetical protein